MNERNELTLERMREGLQGRINHQQLAERLGVPTAKVCVKLAYMHRKGMVRCVKPSGRGPNAEPGIWELND